MRLDLQQRAAMRLRWSKGQHQVDYGMDAVNLEDTCAALEAELAASRSQLKNITDNAYILENTIRLLRTENADREKAARELGPCKHPKMFLAPKENFDYAELAASGVTKRKLYCSLCDREKAAIAAARLEEAEWWYGLAVEDGGVSEDLGLAENKRLAQLRAAITPDQSAAQGGAPQGEGQSPNGNPPATEGSVRTEG